MHAGEATDSFLFENLWVFFHKMEEQPVQSFEGLHLQKEVLLHNPT